MRHNILRYNCCIEKNIIFDTSAVLLSNKKIAYELLPIHRAVACLPRIEHAFIFFFFSASYFARLYHVHAADIRSATLSGPQLVQVPRALVVVRGRPCAHVRPRSTRWYLRWIWRCFAPREPYFWPSVLWGPPSSFGSFPHSSSSSSSLFPLAHPYRRSRSREAPVWYSRDNLPSIGEAQSASAD